MGGRSPSEKSLQAILKDKNHSDSIAAMSDKSSYQDRK